MPTVSQKNIPTPGGRYGPSSVFEDGIHSFAGQFDTELNIRPGNLVSAYKHVLAGKFTDRAVNYRIHKNIRGN